MNAENSTEDVNQSARNSTGLVGTEIRKLRKMRKMTLSNLGDVTGLSVGYLSQIERNLSSPTVKALFDISHALGVSINWFFHEGESAQQDEEQFVVRHSKRRSIRYEAGITDQLLNTSAVQSFEFLYSTFEPQATTERADPYAHEGEECGIVISGQLQLFIDGTVYSLQAGDSFSFPSTLKHSYFNPVDDKAEVIWCTSPPSY